MQSPCIGPGWVPASARVSRRPTGIFLVVALVLVLAVTRKVQAAPGTTGHVELTTSEGCGSADTLARRVAQRSPRVRLSAGGDGATVVRVNIGPGAHKTAGSGALVSATVTVQQGGAAPWTRRVDDVSCSEALDAVALILAVALDPERAAGGETPATPLTTLAPVRPAAPARASGTSGGHRPARSGQPARVDAPPSPAADGSAAPAKTSDAASAPRPPTETASPSSSPPSPTAAATPPATGNDGRPVADRPPEKPSPLVEPPPPPPPEPPVPDRPLMWLGAVGLAGAMTTVPAPSVMPGVGGYLWLGVDRGSIWSPAGRVGVSHFWASRFPTATGTARFTADLATLELCPLWQHGNGWGLGICAAVTAGIVTGQGTQSFAAQTRRRPFLAPGATVIAAIEPGKDLQVTVWVNGATPLIRDRFQFAPEVFYEVPRVSLTAGVGVGWRFW